MIKFMLFPLILFLNTLIPAENLNPDRAYWRHQDGTVVPAPSERGLRADGGRVLPLPAAEGGPAFAIPFGVEAGDVVSVGLEVEAVRLASDAGAEGQAGVVLTVLPSAAGEANNPDAIHRQIVIVGSERESVVFAFRVPAAFAAGELLLLPAVSFFGRALEIADLVWTLHGAEADPGALTQSGVTYPGQEPEAPWRAEAARKIDLHRKADLRVSVTDRWGVPLPGVAFSVEQLSHAYPFGTAVVSSRIVDGEREFSPESGMTPAQWRLDNARYREELLRNFNTVVIENDLKWPQWSRDKGRGVHHPNWTLEALDWFRDQDLTVKGHNLVWGSWRFTPEWLREQEGNPDALQTAILAHIRDVGHATSDRTAYWDVLNEPMSHRNLIELLGTESVAAWFREARRVMPGTRLVMNEFDLVGNGGSEKRLQNFLEFYGELKAEGAPLDLIGFQAHFWSDRFTAPERIWEIIDRTHAATGLPLMVSEFDSNVPNERLQAEYTRDFLTAWFAHPATEAFIMWGFWGGAHWMGDSGAMYRRDWSEKPNLAAYRDLVFGEWWTREEAVTDGAGQGTVRAFQGRHRVSLRIPGSDEVLFRDVSLPKEGRELHIVVPAL